MRSDTRINNRHKHIRINNVGVIPLLMVVVAGMAQADSNTDRVADQFRQFCLRGSTAEIPAAGLAHMDRYLSSLAE